MLIKSHGGKAYRLCDQYIMAMVHKFVKNAGPKYEFHTILSQMYIYVWLTDKGTEIENCHK